MKLQVGDKAPDFKLPDQTDKIRTLKEFKDKWVLIYFYPKDNTPGCTIEACTIRDNYKKYNKENLIAIGVSKDSVKSHDGFVSRFKLPFILLSDEKKIMIKDYNAWQKEKSQKYILK